MVIFLFVFSCEKYVAVFISHGEIANVVTNLRNLEKTEIFRLWSGEISDRMYRLVGQRAG